MKIGFIGLGAMGRPMAKNVLKKSGYSVVVNDINEEAVEELVRLGAEKANTPAAVAKACDIIIIMVPNSPHVETVVLGENGLIHSLSEGKIVIDMSTIDPAVTRFVAEKVERTGAKMIDAPVGKTTDHAKEGTLSIMVGGDEEVYEKCKPILSCMGTELIYCGPIGSGHTMKIINNLLTGIIVTANAEVLSLGVKSGLKLDTMLKVLRSTAANNGHLNITFPTKAFKGDFSPGFATRLAFKDMNLALSLSSQMNFPLHLGAACTQVFNMARSLGFDDEDYTSVLKVMEQFANVQVREV